MPFPNQHDDSREQVRQAVDIVDLVGSYLELRRQGRNFVARCPWHDDSRPSLQVNPERQSWKCWVCNIGGDIFSFVMQREGIGFREALEMLAQRAGIELRSAPAKAVAPGSPDDKNTLYAAMAWAENQFHECLLRSPLAEVARAYVAERQLSPETVRKWRIGFAPDEWQWLVDRARSTPYSVEILEAVDLVGRSANSGRPYDRFKGRLLFPIRDVQKRTIALGGRVIPALAQQDQAKYINSRETRLFSKSDTLYGLDIARDAAARSRELMVMEGYTDVIAAHQAGLDTAVACLGTALNERHLRLIKRFADRLILVLDGDEAGQRRTNELLQLFVAEQIDLRILTLPEEFDPAEFLLERGGAAFGELLATAVDPLAHKFALATRGINLDRDTHQANQALEGMLEIIAKAPRIPLGDVSAHNVRVQTMLSKLARMFGVSESDLRVRMTDLRRAAGGKNISVSRTSASELPLDSAECEVLELLTLHPELAPLACELIRPEQLTSPLVREVYQQVDEFVAAGEEASFDRLLTRLDDPHLKHLLVQCDESGRRKRETRGSSSLTPPMPPEAQLRQMAETLVGRGAGRAHLARQRTIEQSPLTEEEQLKLLLETLEQQKRRQGFSPPTDG